MSTVHSLTLSEAVEFYRRILAAGKAPVIRALALDDLYFLLAYLCRRRDMLHPWVYARVREFEASPDGHLDLWARGHYKSTVITFGGTLQEILRDPEITVGIFSHTRPAAKAFLRQLQRELEANRELQALFPDVLFTEPAREAPMWSLDSGLIVRRKGNPKEGTVEASGLVDGQPTGKHYALVVYDDVVTLESVTTPEQIEKTTSSWELSLNLIAAGGKRRYVGTTYHFNDTYKTIRSRGAASARVHPATADGTMEGVPVLLTRVELAEKRRDMGPYTFACQLLLNPVADRVQGFQQDWLRFYDIPPKTAGWNIYLLVDPASEKKVRSDYTVMAVIGLAPDNNYYLLDMVRDRLNLTERANALFDLVNRWHPIRTGYEHYGLQADVEFVTLEMERRNWRFPIIKLGGQMPKNDRIRRTIPLFEQGRFWLPRRLLYVDRERRSRDLINEFVHDEYLAFPVAEHDDMLDCLARIMEVDLKARFPAPQPPENETRAVSMTTSRYKVV